MNILDKTIFKKKNLEILGLENKINDLNSEFDYLNAIIKNLTIHLNQEKEAKEIVRRKYAGALGGCKKEINKLKKELIETKQELSETKDAYEKFKEGKYLVREIKPQRIPKAQQMRIKSAAKTSLIMKKLKPLKDD